MDWTVQPGPIVMFRDLRHSFNKALNDGSILCTACYNYNATIPLYCISSRSRNFPHSDRVFIPTKNDVPNRLESASRRVDITDRRVLNGCNDSTSVSRMIVKEHLDAQQSIVSDFVGQLRAPRREVEISLSRG